MHKNSTLLVICSIQKTGYDISETKSLSTLNFNFGKRIKRIVETLYSKSINISKNK